MGCGVSFPRPLKASGRCWSVSPSKQTSLELRDHQKQLLRETWAIFKLKKIAIGRKMFVNLFQVYPEMPNLFPEFKDAGSVECIEETRFLNGHSKRLMTALENTVSSLDDTHIFNDYLEELGRRHKTRKLMPKYFKRMGAALILTLQEYYPELWNTELENAWYTLYQLTTMKMIDGLNSA